MSDADIVERLDKMRAEMIAENVNGWPNTCVDVKAELLRLRGEVERLTHANRTREDYDLHCTQCGKAHILDTVLTSEIWNQIAAPEDLLCTLCIDDRLAVKGLTFSEAEFYYGGPRLQSSLYNRHDKARADALQARLEKVREALKLAAPYVENYRAEEGTEEADNALEAMFAVQNALASLTEGEK